MSDTCEHGHLRRVCEVCELKAEVARLREVCSDAAYKVLRVTVTMIPGTDKRSSLMNTADMLQATGKEPTP